MEQEKVLTIHPRSKSEELINDVKKQIEGNFIDWDKYFEGKNIIQLVEDYKKFGVPIFSRKIKQKNKEHSLSFFRNFILAFEREIKNYVSIEDKLNLFLTEKISYWDVLFKINILYKYAKQLDSSFKLSDWLENEILTYKANTNRSSNNIYWPEKISKISDKIELYKISDSKMFHRIYNMKDKIAALSFFYCLYKKYKELGLTDTRRFGTIVNYLRKLGYDKIKESKLSIDEQIKNVTTFNNLFDIIKKLKKDKFFIKLNTDFARQRVEKLLNKIASLYVSSKNLDLKSLIEISLMIDFLISFIDIKDNDLKSILNDIKTKTHNNLRNINDEKLWLETYNIFSKLGCFLNINKCKDYISLLFNSLINLNGYIELNSREKNKIKSIIENNNLYIENKSLILEKIKLKRRKIRKKIPKETIIEPKRVIKTNKENNNNNVTKPKKVNKGLQLDSILKKLSTKQYYLEQVNYIKSNINKFSSKDLLRVIDYIKPRHLPDIFSLVSNYKLKEAIVMKMLSNNDIYYLDEKTKEEINLVLSKLERKFKKEKNDVMLNLIDSFSKKINK